MLIEYLYIDQRRLDFYIEQFSSPVTYDKIPIWNAELSITGPKASGLQSRPARPKTTHEKIEELLDYLEDKKLVNQAQLNARGRFGLDTWRATKLIVPAGIGAPIPGRDLITWVTDDISKPGIRLCLIEDSPRDDVSIPAPGLSAFTALTLVLRHASDSLRDRLAGEGRSGERPAYWTLVGRFASDPISVLKEIGGVVMTERRIRTLYRIREYVKDSGRDTFVVGYPIVITEAEDE